MPDRHRQVDVAILGLGLAGATLAWEAHAAGLDIVIVDDADTAAASRVAAGLVTPVTGRKLKPQPGFAELAETALRHYRQAGSLTGVQCYFERPALRLLTEDKEYAAWAGIEANDNELIEEWSGALPAGIVSDGLPALMPAAGRLAIADFVASTRDYFAARGALVPGTVDDTSVAPRGDAVAIEQVGTLVRHAVFCRGYRDATNPFFPELRWRAAKGQILELNCPGFDRGWTVHGTGIWLTADRDERVLAGATYEWDSLDATVTRAASDQLSDAVRAILGCPFAVVGQRAAVRPIVEGRKPVIGHSRKSDRVWMFNGLGSKGALFAPTIAGLLVAHISKRRSIPSPYSLAERFPEAS